MSRPTPIPHDPNKIREPIAGPSSPSAPFPIYLEGWVTRGFGRGSKDLGCPTANLPDEVIEPYATTLHTGVYYGFASVSDPSHCTFSAFASSGEPTAGDVHDRVHPMVMSIGWNPYYNNEKRTAEVHILHEFPKDFYAKELRVVILGYIRPEYNYASLDALIEDINTDKLVASRSVDRPEYELYQKDSFFSKASELAPPTDDPGAVRVKPSDNSNSQEGHK